MKPVVALIDYEMGNLHSVAKALEKAGADVRVTSSAGMIRKADGVVLPGVGAFGEAVKRLVSKKLVSPISETLSRNRPFLGICLGLQLLFERSEESLRTKGLGFFKGENIRFHMSSHRRLKVPHMGWNTFTCGPASETKALRDVKPGRYFYFVHSFYPVPRDSGLIATRTQYGSSFCSSVAKGRIFASQFHPEKSGEQGQIILRNFVKECVPC